MKSQRTPRRRKPPRRTPKAKVPKAAPAAGGAPPARVVKRPAGGGGRPPGPRTRPNPQPASGGISFVTVLLLILALVIAGFMLKVMLPRNLSHIKGFPKPRWQGDERNLLAEAQQSLVNRENPLELSESEVNAYLRDRIKGKQGGPFAAIVKYQGTYVDFEEKVAEIFVVRTVMGMNFSISSRFVVKDLGGGDFKWITEGGSIGGLRTGAKQFEPVAKAILRVADTCKDELDVIKAMGKVRFEKNTVILDPSY